MIAIEMKFKGFISVFLFVLAFVSFPFVTGYASQPCCKNGKISTCASLGGGLSYDMSDCMLDSKPIDPIVPVDPNFPSVKDCMSGYKKCCVDGKLQCVKDTGQLCFIGCESGIDPIEDCKVGTVQYKPDGNCGTISRTCCDGETVNHVWSGWGKACPKTCDGVKPVSSEFCTASNGKRGTRTRTVTCDGSTGTWTTGSWGTCVAPECSQGETKVCPSNKYQVIKCTSSGKWDTYCQCENEGNGKLYCQGMRLTTSEANQCVHGIWSPETCSGMCCCLKDMPKLMNNGSPGCWGMNSNGISMWQYSCTCQRPNSGGGGLIIPNL